MDKSAVLIVADSHRIRKVIPDGTVSTLCGRTNVAGTQDGKGSEAGFNRPIGLAISPLDGTIFVTAHDSHIVRKINPLDGTVSTLCGSPNVSGYQDGKG